jgi:tetratricopeptide (TPR) repeat protein
MPETAKILHFPSKAQSSSLSREEALGRARSYLETPIESRDGSVTSLFDADVLLAVCSILRDQANTAPSQVADASSHLYRCVVGNGTGVGFFDERDYFLGELALIAGGSCRLLGRREDTELWLDRSEASFRHTLNPAPMLARTAYIRLALRYDMRRYEDVLELLPSVALSFAKFGMDEELSKCRFLEALSLKDVGREDESMAVLQRLVAGSEVRCEDGLRGMALVNLGDLHGKREAFELALTSYTEALPMLQRAKRLIAMADLKAMVGDTLRRMGRLEDSLAAYRESVSDYCSLEVSTRAAYARVLLAETLMQAGRLNEAEWEIRAALPTIEREKMVPEGFAAVALLQESVRQRKADPKALSELRQYLQANS